MGHHTSFTKGLRAVLYWADLWAPTESYVEEHKSHERDSKAADKISQATMRARTAAEELPPPPRLLTAEVVECRAMLDHLRTVADISVVYSVPTQLVSLVSLDDVAR